MLTVYENASSSDLLSLAHAYAGIFSGCRKVQVGALIVKEGNIVALGANRAIPNLCNSSRGCLREEIYGDNSKAHRLPADCRAIHSEIDAISHAGCSLAGSTIYITRYPCEACARAIISSGISRVVYGRKQKVSDQTLDMFEKSHVQVDWCFDWAAPDTEV